MSANVQQQRPQPQYQQQQYQWFQQTANHDPPNSTVYPPQNRPQNTDMNPNFHSLNSSVSTKVHEDGTERSDDDDINGRRQLVRTPSPTPSELKAMNAHVLDWKTMSSWRFWIRREWLWYYVALVLILVITALVTIFHKQIVNWLKPATQWLYSLKFGWLVPIGILFVISFPPLFGHEIVAILCGLVWGLWVGFAIVCAGTFLGEVGNFYAFKYCCRARGEKLERTKITYACLAKVVREGGFKIALIARLSAIPGHFTTAIFSTCGMGIIVFCLAAILSLPKQFITVYLGVILEQTGTDGQTDPKSRIISDVVLAVTFLITIAAMWYIVREMNKAKPQVIYERRKARGAKLHRFSYNMNTESNMSFNPSASDTNIPLHQRAPQQHYPFGQDYQYGSHSPVQQGPHEVVFAPRPQHPATNQYGYVKDDDVSSDESSSSTAHDSGHHTKHGYGRPPRQSTEEVEWDTSRRRQPDESHPPRGYAEPRRTMSPESYNPPPQHQRQPPPQGLHEYPRPTQQYNLQNFTASPAQTPTQAQYTFHYQGPTASTAHSDSVSLPYLSNPHPPSSPRPGPVGVSSPYFTSPPQQHQQSASPPQPQQQQYQPPSYHHQIEPTGMSYHTASGSEYDDGDRRLREASEFSVSDRVPGGLAR